MNNNQRPTKPIRSLQSMLYTIAQNDSACLPVLPDGIYGKQTVAAVSRFQQLNGLPATGITDQNTWDHIVQAYDTALTELDAAQPLQVEMMPHSPLCRGACGSCVWVAQAMLQSLSEVYSCPPPSASGTMDDVTEDALCAFQALCGLPMSGQLDKNTWKHLSLQFSLADILQKKKA